MKFRRILLLLLFINTILSAQTGRKFWFGAPDISSTLGDRPVNIHVTALYETTVRLTRPADLSFTPIVFHLNPLEHRVISLESILGASGNWETIPQDGSTGGQNKGFLIESEPGEINVYYELDHTPDNRDIMPMKGESALGRYFTVSTQNMFHNSTSAVSPWSGFVVVATEDNTQLTVYPNGNVMYYFPGPPDSINLTLHRGQTFSFRSFYPDSLRHLNGINVKANREIAITVYDDGLNKGCAYDLIADQIVPEKFLGTEYVIQRGFLDTLEAVFVTATQNGTTININGVSQGIFSKNQVFRYVIPPNSKITRLTSSEPVYAMHMSGISCKVGGALLPSFERCVGSYELTFTRTSNVTDAFYIRLIGRNETNNASPYKNQAAENFYIVVDSDTTNIPRGYFAYTSDSAFVYLTDSSAIQAYIAGIITPGKQVKIINSVARFHYGTIMGGPSNGMKYGYISDYGNFVPSAGIGGFTYLTEQSICNLNPVQLAAGRGIHYVWTALSNPAHINLLSNDSIASPVFDPDTSDNYIFNVKISGNCHSDTNIVIRLHNYMPPTSNFTLSTSVGCSPLTIEIDNKSDTLFSSRMIWNIAPTGGDIDQDTIPRTFNWTFPLNNSDTAQIYKVKLYSYSPGDYCFDEREKQVTVLPGVTAAFNPSSTSGCSTHNVSFENLSTSGHDSLSYCWDFGNNTQSVLAEPEVSYTNLSLNDTVFLVELIAETPFGCTDTAFANITVHPRIEAIFSVDTNFSCSPLRVTLDPSGSIGVDTLFWHYDLFYKDSTSKSILLTPVILTHTDTSWSTGPDTLRVTLIAMNRMGCVDTSFTPELIVYPKISALFDVSVNTLCDSDSIQITNLSVGYNPFYSWSFGDNTFVQDSTGKNYTKIYFNRSNSDTIYNLSLKAVSEKFCEDTYDTLITVHPYLKADFGFEYTNNCSPLSTEITNTSIRVDQYAWDLGDGTTSTSSAAAFTHVYTNPLLFSDTTFTLKLVATSLEGCMDSLSRTLMLLPQVISDFNITETAICSPDSAHFQNNSTGNTLTFLWNFGDGQSSTNSAPSFSKYYENFSDSDTMYSVSLIARNSVGCSDTSDRNINVLAYIDAAFSIPKADSCSPFRVRLQNASSSGAKVFNWDLGPAGINNEFEPSILPIYTNTSLVEDTINIELIAAGANDALHLACADTHRLPVVIYPELSADFSLDNYASCQPYTGAFTNNSQPTSGTNYLWYLNSVFYSNQAVPGNIVVPNNTSDSTTHRIWLYGTTKHGCTDTAWKDITVYALVNAYFTTNKAALCSYDSVFIDRSSSIGGIVSYEWNFNNEFISYSASPAFYYSQFDNPGNVPESKTISLTALNNKNCSSVWVDSVSIFPHVTASYNLDTNQSCFPHISEFNNTSVNAAFYLWNFGDGISSAEVSPKHLYSNFSTILDSIYPISLIARSTYNCYDTATGQMRVNAKPISDFYFPVTIGCPPFEAEMINTSAGNTLNFAWDFAGEGTSSEQNPTFLFSNTTNAIHVKPVTLEVITANGCSDTITKELSVYPNVDTNFTYTADQGCSPLSIEFESLADPTNIQQILWFVDNKAFANITNPQYRFVNNTASDKVFEVKFKVYSVYNCSDSAWMPITVYPSPSVNFIPDPVTTDYNTTEDRTQINFLNVSQIQDNWSYRWDYGDGNTDTQSVDSFVYYYGDHFWGANETGNKIPVKLTGWNSSNPECRDSIEYFIVIKPPRPEINIFEDLTGCQPFTVDFNAYTKYSYANSFLWEFGDSGASSINDSPVYIFDDAGTYSVRLTVEGDGGLQSDYKVITVLPQPKINFSFNDTIVFTDDDKINFYNYSVNGQNYQWYFDSEKINRSPDSYDQQPVWTYPDPGFYHVALIANSIDNCSDTMIHPIGILVLEKGTLQFPTAFFVNPGHIEDEYATDQSVNGGNRNLFYPKEIGVAEYHLEIYSRWGTLIFTSKDVKRGWNGLIDGIPGEQGVYIWRARGRYANGTPFDISGDVTLIRGDGRR